MSRARIGPKQPGLSPGTLVYMGTAPMGSVRARAFDYDEHSLEEKQLETVAECLQYRLKDTITWLDVEGVHDVELVETLGGIFGVHPLTLEDVVNTNQRPKMEEYPEYLYLVVKMLRYDHETCDLDGEQVSLIVGRNFLISFQEAKEGDVFDPVRSRLRENRGKIRRSGSDYLLYALLDLIVDYYLSVLEGLGEHIEELEDAVLEHPEPPLLRQMNKLRRHVTYLRRSIWPLREILASLERSELPFMAPENNIYFRDVYDHTVRTVEIIETSRDLLTSMVDLYMSSLSFRMNEVMKVLAIISTIFLPLTFIAGIYGMNFNPEASPFNMPELNWLYGYPFALALMFGVALAMVFFFRKRRWL